VPKSVFILVSQKSHLRCGELPILTSVVEVFREPFLERGFYRAHLQNPSPEWGSWSPPFGLRRRRWARNGGDGQDIEAMICGGACLESRS
jgi:hypothetical protein